MKFYKTWLFIIYYFLNIIKECYLSVVIGQSDRSFIQFQDIVYQSNCINAGSNSDTTIDISSGKFKKTPQILYALHDYNSDNCLNQGFTITTLTLSQTSLKYRLTSLGCEIDQLHFDVLAIDDPNVEIQSKKLSSVTASTITGKSKIMYIAGFIYGFKGSSTSTLVLKYTLTKVDDTHYSITFLNSNVSDVYLNFVIVYEQSNTDMFEQLYSYETAFDTRGVSTSGTTLWQTSTNIDSSQIVFGLKDFSITSNGYFGIKIQNAQKKPAPAADSKTVQLNYFTWNGYKVNMVNGVFMAFKLATCSTNQYMFITSTSYQCVSSCNTVDHHYNNNPAITQQLYTTILKICSLCDAGCFGCSDGSPTKCTDCYSGLFFNPINNSCQSTQPAHTACTSTTVSGQTFQKCSLCHSTCVECTAANSPTSCSSCNSGQYLYNGSCSSAQPSGTYCDSNLICYACDSSCLTCATSSTNCVSCKPYLYFYQNKCTSTVPSGAFCLNLTTCQQCDATCATCIASAKNCTDCNSGQYLYQNTCSPQKPSGVFCVSSSNGIYQKCTACSNTACLECTQTAPTQCISCPSINFLYKGNCFSVQPPNTYCDSNNNCNDCDKSCNTCNGGSSNNCITCSIYRALDANNVCNCIDGFYQDASKICQRCDSSCTTCSGGLSSQCSTCGGPNKYYYQGTCLPNQPDSTYCDSNFKCQKCDPSCKSCNGLTNNNCTSCFTGFDLHSDNTCQCPSNQFPQTITGQLVCSNCDSSCKTCNGPLASNCLSCANYFFNNSCSLNQPPKTYCDVATKQCQSCNIECKTCQDSASNCTSCEDTYYQSGSSCLVCSGNCQTCNGSGANQCITCKGQLQLSSMGVCECASNQYIDKSNYNCSSCNSTCQSCTGPNPNDCSSCSQAGSNPYQYNNQCLSTKPDKTFCDSNNICQDCSSNCLTCNGTNIDQCLSCSLTTFFYNGKCSTTQPDRTYCDSSKKCYDCDRTCGECSTSATNCTSCLNSQYLQNNKCSSSQPPKTVCTQQTQNTTSYYSCQPCDSSCLSCSGITPNDCTACDSSMFLYKKQCVPTQPNGTYCVGSTCYDCNSDCSSCTGPNNTDCSSCQGSKVISPDSKLCVCSSGYYLSDQTNPSSSCAQCFSDCATCTSGTTCSQCVSGSFLYNNQCLSTQPPKTYCQNFICHDCNSACSTCTGSNATNCLKCNGNQIIDSQSSLCACPTGTYLSNSSTQNCSNCVTGCTQCSNSTQCDICGKSSITGKQLYQYQNQCIDSQPGNTYCDPTTFVCQQCSATNSCKTCDDTLKNCISCSTSQYLYKGQCSTNPPKPNGVYCDPVTLVCTDCDPNCFNCSEKFHQCTECSKSQYLYENKCYDTQPSGSSCSTSQKNTGNDSFTTCSVCTASNCMSCNKTASKCDSCIQGAVLDSKGESCTCPEGTFISTNTSTKLNFCKQCSKVNCAKCTENVCISCLSGYYQNQKNECEYCSNSTFTNINNQCTLPCKEGCQTCTSLENCVQKLITSKNCHVSCATCSGPLATECVTCSSLTRIFDATTNTCNCKPNYENNQQTDCQYIYQVPQQVAQTQSALSLAQFSFAGVSTVTNFIPGMSYTFGLMQLLGNFYIKQDKSYNSTTSVLSSYTKFNMYSLFQQKVQSSSSGTSGNSTNSKEPLFIEKNGRILDQSTDSVYPISQSDDSFIIVDKIYFAQNSFIQICLIMFMFLIAGAFHYYQTRTKEDFKYVNIIRWNMLLFTIQLSSNFMVLTLFQCKFADQRMLDWVFLGLFVIIYAVFNIYVFNRIYKNEHLDSAVSILSDGVNQESKYSRFFFIIFEMRKLVYCFVIACSKHYLNYSIWVVCVIQAASIFVNYKQKVFTNKSSNVILITTEFLFFLIVTFLGVMINLSDEKITKMLATATVVLMIILSLFTVVAMLYLFVMKLKDLCCKNKRNSLQSTELSFRNTKIQLIENTIDMSQAVKWNVNPLKRKTGSNPSNSFLQNDSFAEQVKDIKSN